MLARDVNLRSIRSLVYASQVKGPVMSINCNLDLNTDDLLTIVV